VDAPGQLLFRSGGAGKVWGAGDEAEGGESKNISAGQLAALDRECASGTAADG
jgi:hypothetical protein